MTTENMDFFSLIDLKFHVLKTSLRLNLFRTLPFSSINPLKVYKMKKMKLNFKNVSSRISHVNSDLYFILYLASTIAPSDSLFVHYISHISDKVIKIAQKVKWDAK